jgi:hypothetical protein
VKGTPAAAGGKSEDGKKAESVADDKKSEKEKQSVVAPGSVKDEASVGSKKAGPPESEPKKVAMSEKAAKQNDQASSKKAEKQKSEKPASEVGSVAGGASSAKNPIAESQKQAANGSEKPMVTMKAPAANQSGKSGGTYPLAIGAPFFRYITFHHEWEEDDRGTRKAIEAPKDDVLEKLKYKD